MLQLSTKRWNSTFNALGARLTIVVVQVRAVKIYLAASCGGALEKRKDGMKFSLPPKLMVFWVSTSPLSPPPPTLNANVFFCRSFLISPCVWLCLSYFMDNSIITRVFWPLLDELVVSFQGLPDQLYEQIPPLNFPYHPSNYYYTFFLLSFLSSRSTFLIMWFLSQLYMKI
jgi:hypothetical protein